MYIPAKFGLLFTMIFLIIGEITDAASNIIFVVLGLILVFSIPALSKMYKKKYEELENLYKTEIEFMFQEYLPDMHYSPFEGISEDNYRFANFSDFDLFESEDYIYGKMDDRNFIISEVSTYIR